MHHTKKEIDAGIAEALKKAQDAENAGAREFVAAINELRRRIVLAVTETGKLDTYTGMSVKATIADIVANYDERLVGILTDNQRRLFLRGLRVIDAAAQGADIHVAVPYLNEKLLDQAKTFGAELVTNLTDDGRGKIAQQIDLAVMGQSPLEATLKAIGTNLEDTSIFGTIAKRAATIYRTEVNRMQNLAAVKRMEQMHHQVPDLQKRWLHSHIGIPRPNHLLMDGVTIPANEQFKLMGRDGEIYMIDGPHDPELPPEEVINCRCVAIPIVGRYAK